MTEFGIVIVSLFISNVYCCHVTDIPFKKQRSSVAHMLRMFHSLK